jgi:hypothetical protein
VCIVRYLILVLFCFPAIRDSRATLYKRLLHIILSLRLKYLTATHLQKGQFPTRPPYCASICRYFAKVHIFCFFQISFRREIVAEHLYRIYSLLIGPYSQLFVSLFQFLG